MIKESCIILNRVFTTVEFKDTMETFKNEPEKMGQHILIKEEEEMDIFGKEPEKLAQHILDKEEEEMKIFEEEPKKLGQHILIKEENKMKIFEKEPEQFVQPLECEDGMFDFLCFMVLLTTTLLFMVGLMNISSLTN